MSVRAYFQSNIDDFLNVSSSFVVGELSRHHSQDLVQQQTHAWVRQIDDLQRHLQEFRSRQNAIFFEFGIPRMGKRADVVLVLEGIVFVLEYKVGAEKYLSQDRDQVLDYSLDLKHFHEGSHLALVVPILVATDAQPVPLQKQNLRVDEDGLCSLVRANSENTGVLLNSIAGWQKSQSVSVARYLVGDPFEWSGMPYKPTPTIVQAAQALYQGHDVKEISRSDAGAINLTRTAASIDSIIEHAKANLKKCICFVTGVPGAGKTLAGLNIATSRMRSHEDEHAVFLSGNGPLVTVLREALARDQAAREDLKITEARRKASTFIQNIHHFRDDNLDMDRAPVERVVVFDEAQRAWDRDSTAKFMEKKRGQIGFGQSEPEFLIGVMDRHPEWCVVVALIGGGQEINTGEAGLPEWFDSLRRSFPDWETHYSSQLDHHEYTQDQTLEAHLKLLNANANPDLHLGVSVRSFRAEKLSEFVGYIIDNKPEDARVSFKEIQSNYPICVTRNIDTARSWLREHTRGSELYGLVASSGAMRLKPEGINVKAGASPAEWFLNGKGDVRSCQYLEDVATEFDIQGLELDWTGLCWDADLRYDYDAGAWSYKKFSGTKWQNVARVDRRRYLVNSYRVLLTRARQGMVIFVPSGNATDPTRPPEFYNGTYQYLIDCGLREI